MSLSGIWQPVKERARTAVAVFHFDPQQQQQQQQQQQEEKDEDSGDTPWMLQLTVGDLVTVREECDHWYFGCLQSNPSLPGLFPKSYVVGLPSSGEDSRSPPIVAEISAVLREWNFFLKEKFLRQDNELIPLLRAIMREVMTMRASLVGGKMTQEETRETQQKVTTKMDFLNHRLGLDLVVRDPNGNILTPERTSSVALYRQHVQGAEKIKNMMLTKPREESEASNTFKIMMRVKNFVSSKVLEDVDLVLSIYEVSSDTKVPKPLCESYIVENWRRSSSDPKDMDRRNNLRVLFADISKNDIMNKRLFLICNVVSNGNFSGKHVSDQLTLDRKVVKSGSKHDLRGNKDGYFRKPVGVAAKEITELFTFKQGKTSEVGRETEQSAPFLAGNDNEPFESVFRKLVFEKRGSENKSLWVTLTIMMGDLSQTLESSLSHLPHHHSMAIARKIGLPEVILPSDFRNDLYVTLVGGDFSRLDKRQDRNVEVTVEVCNENGQPVPDSISGGVGVETVDAYRSVVFYHESKPRWQEVTKVKIQVDMFQGSHLRFTFRHRSSNMSKEKNPPWALAFLKLVHEHDKTALRDGTHELLVFKMEKKFDIERERYLHMPYLKSDQYHLKKTGGNLTALPKDSFTVHTTLCSTKLTQNEGLLSLLKWRDEPDRLNDTLNIFNQKVNGKEFVKSLPDVLDALFAILTEKSDNEEDDRKVFKSLINVIHLITEDSRYQQFVPVLDLYIADNFSATLAYNKLLLVLRDCIDDATFKPKELTQAMKSLKYIFKFVVRSRSLFSQWNGGKGREPFEDSLKEVLNRLIKLMCSTTQDLYQGQAYCLKHMVQAIPDLVQVFNRKQLAWIIIMMIKSLQKDQLTEHKISTLKDLVHSELFSHPECRDVMVPEMADKIRDLLDNADESCVALVTICTETLGDMLDLLHELETTSPRSTHDDITCIVDSCLRTVIQAVANRQRGDSNTQAIVANMIGLLRNMSAQHFESYIQRFGAASDAAGRQDLIDFIMEVLGMFKDLVQNNVFPHDWVSIILLQNSVLLKALRHFANTIRDYLMEPFEYQAWSNFFQCAVTFITQPSLQLEHFSENKKQKIYPLYKDMRKEMGKIVKSMWFNLGHPKIRFVPDMIGPFLEMTLIPETDLRKETIPIFFDMMQCEFYSSRFKTDGGDSLDTKKDPSMNKANFKEFEREMIEKLDQMIEVGAGDEHYKALFSDIMMSLCESHTALGEPGVKLVRLVTKLLELLLEYRTITNEDSKENQMSCLVNLLDFYQSHGYEILYVKYLKRLCKLHEECRNHAEAGFTLLQYSETLHWSNHSLKHHWRKHSDCETHRALKERLNEEVINHFERGQMWEKALQICKELAVQYEEETFEYEKLAKLHEKMAGLYQNIMGNKEVRAEPEYFRVAFYGRGFPAFLQNKVFVYRGRGFERLPDFQGRILDQFPNAELMKSLRPPTEEEKQRPVQLLQINKVDPLMGESKFEGKNVQNQILNYYKVNDVWRFIYSRPVNKGNNKENEFASLWIERTFLETRMRFPGILQWFPLAQPEEIVMLCPLENAVETMQRANEELRSLILDHQNQSISLNPLTMKLNGIIDAAVMGGTANYEQAFFTEKYRNENPEHAGKIRALENLIAEQIPLLEVGVKIHGYKRTEDLKPLHERLETMFGTMRTSVEHKYGKRYSDISVSRGASVGSNRKSANHQGMEVRRQHQSHTHLTHPADGASPATNGRLSSFPSQSEVRASMSSQNSIDASSKRMLSAFIGISRKKSNASSRDDGSSRSSFIRSSHSNSTLLENGGGHNNSGHSYDAGDAPVLITMTPSSAHTSTSRLMLPGGRSQSRPTSGQYLIGGNTPPTNHSRSPSINSNRDSLVSAEDFPDPPPPVLPPKSHCSRVLGGSDPENMSMSSIDESEKPADRSEEIYAPRHIIVAKKKPPPPPPPQQQQAPVVTPPTPPKKPPFKLPIEEEED